MDTKTGRIQGSWRRRVQDILEYGVDYDPLSTAVNTVLVALIVLNVIAFSAETVPAVAERYGSLFNAFNVFSVAVFTIEYALRLWSCPMLPRMPAWRSRLRFALRPLIVIDLLAFLPFYLSFLVPLDLRILRVFRLFRFLKLARYSPALQSLLRVFANERRALVGAFLVMMALLLFAATGIHFLERDAQPDVFGSIPAAAWWALATLTTVGYGDAVPVTALGKMFGSLVMVFGLAMFALPIAILATGFSQESSRREFVVTWSMVARVPLFADLHARSVAEIMSLLYARSYDAGAEILRAGDPADAMYFVAAGEVMVQATGGTVVLGEGDFFGEMALLDHRAHTHEVTAHTKCRLLLLDKDDFERLCRREPDVLAHVRDVAEARAKASRGASD